MPQDAHDAESMQDLKHLKSVPELVKASPEATQADAPLSISPITLSPLVKEKPRMPVKEAQEKASSFLVDRTPPASRLPASRCSQRALSPHPFAVLLCHPAHRAVHTELLLSA